MQTIAKGIADAESMLKAFKKQLEGELTSPGATLLIKEDDGPSVKVAALKERASIAEVKQQSLLFAFIMLTPTALSFGE